MVTLLNPFAEQTSMSYYVLDTATKVQVIFTDQLEHVIKTNDVKPGYGTLVVYAADLSNGQYTYSLVVDGRVLETKK